MLVLFIVFLLFLVCDTFQNWRSTLPKTDAFPQPTDGTSAMLSRMFFVPLSLVLFACLAGRSSGDAVLQVFVERKGNNSWIEHHLPPPSFKSILFSPVFDKGFLSEVLDFKKNLEGLTSGGAKPIALQDVCFMNMGLCVVHSAWSYFQDREKNLDLEKWHKYNFFRFADYLDHIDSCFWQPWLTNDGTALHTSCLADSGAITPGNAAFALPECGLFPNSTSLIITFPFDYRVFNATMEWWRTVQKYVTSAAMATSFPNMTITLVPDPSRMSQWSKEDNV